MSWQQRAVRRLDTTSAAVAVALVAVLSLIVPSASRAAEPRPQEQRPSDAASASGAALAGATVADVPAQFAALTHHGEALAWILPEDEGAPDPSVADHYQGVLRYSGPGTPVFYVTQLDDDDPELPGAPDKGGYLHVVRMPTRPSSGERLRSNVQRVGSDTEDTPPPAADRWVRSVRFDGALDLGDEVLPAYQHPGGMAIVDDVLLMALDQPRQSGSPTGQIVLFDLAQDRLNPEPIGSIPLNHQIDNLALVTEPDGRHLLWVNGDGGDVTRFYRTTTGDLRDPAVALELVQVWDPDSPADRDGAGAGWPTGDGAHQSATFVSESGGQRYLVMGRNDGVVFDDDFLDLYRVDPKPTGGFKLTRVATKHVFCNYDQAGRVCNLKAAASAYVSPSGELLVYSVPHDDQDGFDPDFVRMAEFRHRDMNREGSPLRELRADAGGRWPTVEGGAVDLLGVGLPPADRPWVQLYDDDGFADRSITIGFDDRHLFELSDFDDLDAFGDKTTSVRWRLPVGLDVVLFDDAGFEDRHVVLKGTGRTEAVSDLDDQVVVPGVVEHPGRSGGQELEFSDKTSSLRFEGAEPNPTPTVTWDLDGDFVFGETGAAALRGDEVGTAPRFSAATLDGPLEWPVRLRASNAAGQVADDVAIIDIANLTPGVEITAVSEPVLPHLPVSLDARFFDVAADTHTATVDWGDGTVTAAEVDQSADTLSAEHAYLEAGQRTVSVTVTDDDGDSRTVWRTVTVAAPTDALLEVLARIDALLATASDDAVVAALTEAREALDGHAGGTVENGALDHLAGGRMAAAFVKLEHTLGALSEAEAAGAGDLSADQHLLVAAAASIAETRHADAVAAAGPTPPAGVQRRLDTARALIDAGLAHLADGDWPAALLAFRDAVQRLS